MDSKGSTPLEVELYTENDVPILKLTGSVVDVDVKKFQRKLDQLYKKKNPQIVLDVSCTNYIDSHGLGTIVYYHTLMQREKRELVILNANTDENSYLNRLFELTNLNKVLKIVITL